MFQLQQKQRMILPQVKNKLHPQQEGSRLGQQKDRENDKENKDP